MPRGCDDEHRQAQQLFATQSRRAGRSRNRVSRGVARQAPTRAFLPRSGCAGQGLAFGAPAGFAAGSSFRQDDSLLCSGASPPQRSGSDGGHTDFDAHRWQSQGRDAELRPDGGVAGHVLAIQVTGSTQTNLSTLSWKVNGTSKLGFELSACFEAEERHEVGRVPTACLNSSSR